MTPLPWSEFSALKLLPSYKINWWGIKGRDYLLWLIVLVHHQGSIADWSSLHHGNPEKEMKSISERPGRKENEASGQWERTRQRNEYALLLSSLLSYLYVIRAPSLWNVAAHIQLGLLFLDNPLWLLSQTHPEMCFINCLNASQHGQIDSQDCRPGQSA